MGAAALCSANNATVMLLIVFFCLLPHEGETTTSSFTQVNGEYKSRQKLRRKAATPLPILVL